MFLGEMFGRFSFSGRLKLCQRRFSFGWLSAAGGLKPSSLLAEPGGLLSLFLATFRSSSRSGRGGKSTGQAKEKRPPKCSVFTLPKLFATIQWLLFALSLFYTDTGISCEINFSIFFRFENCSTSESDDFSLTPKAPATWSGGFAGTAEVGWFWGASKGKAQSRESSFFGVHFPKLAKNPGCFNI